MPLFEWNAEYTVFVPQFDDDHKHLFALVNELNDSMSAGHGRHTINNVVAELERYTREHFSREESALRAAGFPGLAAHQAMHRAFVAKVAGFRAQMESGTVVLPIDVLFFLGNWLRDHILQADHEYIELFAVQKRNLGLSHSSRVQ
ncbi:MAG: bacteriohemerythrin [Acidobacteriota bacterium]|nr:bacteriohemerythrin [Acidobacteriota bacterium]